MIHKASPLISADYPFYAGQRIRERLGAGVLPLFAQSCGADNNAPWASGWQRCEQAGNHLGDAVADACARAVELDGPLHFESSVLDVPLKPLPTAEQLQRAIANEQQRPEAERVVNISSSDQLLVARERLRLREQGGAATHMPLEMALLTIGEQCALVMLAGEIFSGYQLAIERISPFAHTAVWAYCHQTENYIPTDAEQARGGYEIKGGPAFYPYRSGPALGAESLILGRVAEMLSRAYSG
jgi:hypothetical protein